MYAYDFVFFNFFNHILVSFLFDFVCVHVCRFVSWLNTLSVCVWIFLCLCLDVDWVSLFDEFT